MFKEAGTEITLASPKWGQLPLDPKSSAEAYQTDATRRLEADDAARAQLAGTLKLSEVAADDYDAVFYPGSHGPFSDLVSDSDSIRLIEDFWADQKPVAAVCHAPIVLVNARDRSGEYIVKGRAVTGFTNGEEDAVQLTDVVPHLVEDTLIDRGGRYAKAEHFVPLTRQDGQLITGQNPASSEPAAALLLKALSQGG